MSRRLGVPCAGVLLAALSVLAVAQTPVKVPVSVPAVAQNGAPVVAPTASPPLTPTLAPAGAPVTIKAIAAAGVPRVDGAELLDHPAWDAAPASEVGLQTAFAGHPSISGSAVTARVRVKALRDAGGLAVRLEWDDPTPDRRLSPERFADAVAIQFPVNGKASTPPFMGAAGQQVNIWYWNAAKVAAENLAADGFGKLARLPTQDVKAYGRHADGRWRVVFRRAWRSPERLAARLSQTSGAGQPVAFAVWNGGHDERDGFKAVTLNWLLLR